jgi:hypothetical protein
MNETSFYAWRSACFGELNVPHAALVTNGGRDVISNMLEICVTVRRDAFLGVFLAFSCLLETRDGKLRLCVVKISYYMHGLSAERIEIVAGALKIW